MDRSRGRRHRALLLDFCPEFPERPDLGDRQELVLVGRERKSDMRRSVDQGLPRPLRKAGGARRRLQHRAEFLGLRCSGIVIDAAVRLEDHARDSHGEEMCERRRHRRLQGLDGRGQAPGAGEYRRGIDTERKTETGRIGRAAGESRATSQSPTTRLEGCASTLRWTRLSGTPSRTAASASSVTGNP